MDLREIHAAYQSIYAEDIVEEVELTEEEIEESIDDAVEYFISEEIEEEDLDQIIEDVGLDDFVEFVLEERKARKMNVKTKKKMPETIAKDAEKEAKRKETKTGEYKEKPKKKPRIGAPAYTTKVKAAPKVKKTVAKVKAAKPAPKKAAPKPAPKKEAPKAPKASKEGIRSKISSAVKKGTARHKAAVKKVTSSKAVKGAKEFGKGFVSGVKDTVTFAKKAKKAVVGETLQALLDTLEEGVELDKFDAVIAYLIDENLAEDFEQAQKMMTLINEDMVNEVYAHQLDEVYTVTNADKRGNTEAWKRYKAGAKNVKTGKPLYKPADHLKDEK